MCKHQVLINFYSQFYINIEIDLSIYSLFVSNTYSCFVLSRVKNYFVIQPKNSKKQIRPGKHGNIMFIYPWHAKIS